jgi:hypothetical protein
MNFQSSFRRKGMKKIFVLCAMVIFTMVSLMPSAVLGAPEGEITGSFQAKAAPSIASVTVDDADSFVTDDGTNITNATTMGFNVAPLVFELNGTQVTLNLDDYTDGNGLRDAINTALTNDGNTTVVIQTKTNGPSPAALKLAGAANETVRFVNILGDVGDIGFSTTLYTGSAASATDLNPLQSYDVSVDVTDTDGIGSVDGGLDNIELKIWWDAAAEQNTEPDFDALTTPDELNYALVTYTRSSNSVSIDSGGGSSWAVTGQSLPTGANLTDPAFTNHTFVFRVTIGEIAREGDGAGVGEWNFAARVIDVDASAAYLAATTNIDVNWYGKVDLGGLTTVDWGRIEKGLLLTDADAQEQVAGIGYVSNGTYDREVKAVATWTSPTAGNITRADVAPGNDQIAIKAGVLAANPAVATYLTAAGVTVQSGLAASTTTTPTVANNYLYLEVAAVFANVGHTYSGTITYVIANG